MGNGQSLDGKGLFEHIRCVLACCQGEVNIFTYGDDDDEDGDPSHKEEETAAADTMEQCQGTASLYESCPHLSRC